MTKTTNVSEKSYTDREKNSIIEKKDLVERENEIWEMQMVP